uniref:LRRNT domain-containing protein n=1 Tax=Xiphophorus maculatus TaxID=8083 RepID=A0A3B5QIT9_XIPMA
MCKTDVRGSCCHPAVVAMLLLLCLGFVPTVAPCPPHCLCASDIISCSGSNLSTLPFGLPSYATRLDLSHNALRTMQVMAAFTATPRLLHLDLSSNQLRVLNSSVFSGLTELKELLLIGNQIAQIMPGAFSDVNSLQRLYLSANRLTSFPLGLFEDPTGPRNLTFLDLRHAGIYLQENPLLCDCALIALLEYWLWKQYRPLVDFQVGYQCRGTAVREVNCTHQDLSDIPLEAQSYRVEPGDWLRVPCPGLAAFKLQMNEVCVFFFFFLAISKVVYLAKLQWKHFLCITHTHKSHDQQADVATGATHKW